MSDSLLQALALTPIGDHRWEGPAVESVMARTFGGQLLAQSLAAALRDNEHTHGYGVAVDQPGWRPHSLHAYFVRPTDSHQSVEYRVETIRNGRSYRLLHVGGFQDDKQVVRVDVSLAWFDPARPVAGIEHAAAIGEQPQPDTLAPGFAPGTTLDLLTADWKEVDFRVIPDEHSESWSQTKADQRVWLRHTADHEHWYEAAQELDLDPISANYCLMAYLSDMTLLQSSLAGHEGREVQEASLDHAMWFYHPMDLSDWILYWQQSPQAGEGRALTIGHYYNRQGELLATAAQQGLARFLKDGATSVPIRTQPGS